jgi:ribonuclease HIII
MWLVTLIDQNNLAQTRIFDQFSEVGEYRVNLEMEVKAGNHADPLSLRTFTCESEGIAREMAAYCVRARPSLTAYMSEVKKMVQAEVPKPVYKTVDARGVLPE